MIAMMKLIISRVFDDDHYTSDSDDADFDYSDYFDHPDDDNGND